MAAAEMGSGVCPCEHASCQGGYLGTWMKRLPPTIRGLHWRKALFQK